MTALSLTKTSLLMLFITVFALFGGCRETSSGKAGRKFAADHEASADEIFKAYKNYIADVELHTPTSAVRSAAVAISGDSNCTLLLGSFSRLGRNYNYAYRVYFENSENNNTKMGANYLAGIDAAILKLPQAANMPLPIDIADKESLVPGKNAVILYLSNNGPIRAAEAIINAIGPGGPAHCPKILLEVEPAVTFDTAIVFASKGGGLAAIVSPESFRNDGLVEALPAWALLRKDFWQYTGDRYGISQLIDKVDLTAASP